MFGLIMQVLVGLFSLTSIANTPGYAKCISLIKSILNLEL